MTTERLTAREFERLFNEKYEQLYYFAFDYVADGGAARDIVSEVFATIWRQRDRIILGNINSYLHISVRNRCLDHLKAARRIDTSERELPDLPDDTDWDERESLIRQLQEEIRRLSPKAQWMLKEKYYNGKTYKEMSEMLGITVDGVKKLVTRTFAELRRKVKVNSE